mmetsp:Transcript_5581/g.6992  ORF Transcript_5581/g.6992 Transcript_5581/m.6992 type:complete len:154 (+) Transcript_5581:21-482(+)
MPIDEHTIAVVKQTWLAITTNPEQREHVAYRLMSNYLRVVPSAQYFFPVISEEGITERGLYLISCINRIMTLLENQNDTRFESLLQNYGRILLRFHISPPNYDTAWFALIETLQDVYEENFTELLLFYWIDVMDPINQIMKRGTLRRRRPRSA